MHWIELNGKRHDQAKTSLDWSYTYATSPNAKPHAPTRIGNRAYRHDANGNNEGWTSDLNGTGAQLLWDDDNRLVAHVEGGAKDLGQANGKTQHYTYDDQGERVIKRGMQGETVYVNQWFTVRNGEIGSKHVYAGATRIATQMVMGQGAGTRSVSGTHSQNDPNEPNGLAIGQSGAIPPGILQAQGLANRSAMANARSSNTTRNPWLQALGSGATTAGTKFLYFYHPDHLGSTGLVTDSAGKPYEHIQYFASGETWVQDATNTQRTPYLFTGKELDEETGLYYFGARHYDPRTSIWQSTDPILDQYLDGQTNVGVYNSPNLALYAYSYNNPINLKDPDGNAVNLAAGGIGAVVGGVIGAGVEGWRQVATGDYSMKRLGAASAGGAVSGGLAGLTMGTSLVAQAGVAGTVGVVATTSAAGGSTTRALMGEEVNARTVATDATVGVATFGVLKGAGIGASRGLEVASGKFDYMFGRVTSNVHNAARSNQLALEMKRLGVPDSAVGRQMLTEHLAKVVRAEGNVKSTFSNQYGKFEVRESLFMGPSGKAAKFESTFQVLDDGTRRLSTVIPYN